MDSKQPAPAQAAREPSKPAPAEPRVLDAAELAAAAGGAAKPGIVYGD